MFVWGQAAADICFRPKNNSSYNPEIKKESLTSFQGSGLPEHSKADSLQVDILLLQLLGLKCG